MARKPKIRAAYKMVSPPTWELARAAYLGGKTAAVVAEQFNIGLQNLRQNIFKNGWSKRALADALAGRLPGVEDAPPPPDPLAAALATHATAPPRPPAQPDTGPAAATAPDPAEAGLMDIVLRRAREALTAGRGGEASALLKAAREYVIVQQDVVDARDAVSEFVGVWDKARPGNAGALNETLMVQTLHGRWSRLSESEQAARIDPDGKLGLRAWVNGMLGKMEVPERKGRG